MSDELNFRKNRSLKNIDDSNHSEAGMEWNIDSTARKEHSKEEFSDNPNNPYAPPFINGDQDNESSDFQPDIGRFLAGIWQRRWLVVITAWLVTSIVLALVIFGIDRHWQASTTLIKRTHQDRMSLAERDPFKSQDYNLATLLDTLKLPSSLEQVRQQLGLGVNITTLATAIEVALGRDSKIINLKVTWDDPVIAAKTANLVAHIFIERTRALLREDAKTAYEYYSAQLNQAREKTGKLSSKVLAFKQQNAISDLDAETKVILEEMSKQQGNYNTKMAETDALREAKKRLIKAIEKEPEQVITYTIYRSPLENRLADYEWELRDALSKYTGEYPKVTKLKERISALKNMIEQYKDEAVPENTYAPNTKLEKMELRLQQLTDDIQLNEAKASALHNTLKTMEKKLTVLASHDKDFMMMQARLDGMLNLENKLAHRVEETRLVMLRNDASFDVIEKASPPSEPRPTGRKLFAVIGLFLGVASGLLLPILLELRDPYLRSRRDLESLTATEISMALPERDNSKALLIDINHPVSEISNHYRGLLNDIDASGRTENKLLGVVSVESGTGCSLVAANLTMARSIKGQPSLLIDTDLRPEAGIRSSVHLGLDENRPGLYEHLIEGEALKINEGHNGMPDVITAGARITDTKALLELSRHNLLFLPELSSSDHHTIVDLPPLAGLEPSYEFAKQIGDVIVVTRSGHTRRDELKHCMDQLEKRGINVIASIILDVASSRLGATERRESLRQVRDNSAQGISAHA